MISEEVLALDRQREEQAQAKQQAEQQALAEKNRQAFHGLVWQIYEGEEIAPEKVLEMLDKCDHSAHELDTYLKMLEERQQKLDWLAENVETETIQTIGQRLEDAKKAFEEAQERYRELNRNFTHDRQALANREARRATLQGRISEIDQLIPHPTKAKG